MREFVIISIEPQEGDYNTIPHFRVYDRKDFRDNGLHEGSSHIATIFRNYDKWEFLRGEKEPTFNEPDAEVEVISNDELSEVKRVASQFLDASAVFFHPQLVLEVI